jgi:iron complex outermembrane recepter protein
MKKLLILSLILLLPLALFAQRGTIVGKVTDSDNGDELVGANVLIKGTSIGAASGMNGTYKIAKVPPGSYTLRATFMGYKMAEKDVQVSAGQDVTVDFELDEDVIYGEAIGIIADRAKERETPVAFTNIKKQEFVQRLGSRDIPLVLNTTPSVYATQGGGGAGDARVNVRGFNQRNVAIMINGVPVNDMENGWVYWSNWDGVADATSSIQMQRGLSAVNLATPSIGGTMNILTDPTAMEAGVNFRQEVGNDGFLKTTVSAASGLVNDKFAFNGTIVRKTGDGLIDKTWTDAWAYYFGASWNINPNNRVELYALGAPQRHGQNLYKQNIGVYDKSFAEDLDGYDPEAFDKFKEAGRTYNQNWAKVSSGYSGQQTFWEGTHDRYDKGFINERENFFHKPQVNLNWYTKLTDKLSVFTVAYYSGGRGGGTGTYGRIFTRDFDGQLGDDDYKYYYGPSPWYRDWDATIAMNQGPAGTYYVDKRELTKEDGQSLGILRNSRNNQYTIGAISKVQYKVSDAFKTTVGVDWRTAEIEHYREVRDLMGGQWYMDYSSDFWDGGKKVKAGDKIAYNNTNTVDWLGFFAQGEYIAGRISAYGMAGYSMIKYSLTDHFTDDGTGKELFLDADWISGIQVKGGASYKVTSIVDVYANAGYVSKVPIFDNVIDDVTGTMSDDPKNETFISIEGGVNFTGLLDNTLTTKVSLYNTTWNDRAYSRNFTDANGDESIIFLKGMNALHQGVEIEAAYQPMSMFRVDAAVSLGNWKLTDDIEGSYKTWDPETGGSEAIPYSFYVKDLKVGDAPQTQFALAASVYPIQGMFAQVVAKHYRSHYADWNPFSRTTVEDRVQSWMAPEYTVLDFHASYDLPIQLAGIKLQAFAHVFNLLDALYIQDAVDNSQYNSWDQDHDADDAEVYFGIPRTFNIGLGFHY